MVEPFHHKKPYYCYKKSDKTWKKKCYTCLATKVGMGIDPETSEKIKRLFRHADKLTLEQYMFAVNRICENVTQNYCLRFKSPFAKPEEGNLVTIISSEVWR